LGKKAMLLLLLLYIYCWELETTEDVPSFHPFQVSMIILLNKKEDAEVYLERDIFP